MRACSGRKRGLRSAWTPVPAPLLQVVSIAINLALPIVFFMIGELLRLLAGAKRKDAKAKTEGRGGHRQAGFNWRASDPLACPPACRHDVLPALSRHHPQGRGQGELHSSAKPRASRSKFESS